MEDAYKRIVAVRDDDSLSPAHKHQLDYAAMLLLHELTMREEAEDDEPNERDRTNFRTYTYSLGVTVRILDRLHIEYKVGNPFGYKSSLDFKLKGREYHIDTNHYAQGYFCVIADLPSRGHGYYFKCREAFLRFIIRFQKDPIDRGPLEGVTVMGMY